MATRATTCLILALALAPPSVYAADGAPPPSKMSVPRTLPSHEPAAKPPALTAKVLGVHATAIVARAPASVVKVGATSWRCRAKQCEASGGAELAQVGACQTLARRIGRIESYKYTGGALDNGALAECNRVALAVAPSVRVTPPPARTMPITIEANYIARAVNPFEGSAANSSAPAGPPITIEANYIARVVSAFESGAAAQNEPAGPPILVEVNYIARPLSR